MQALTANCPACGAPYGDKITTRFLTCEYCGTRFALSEEEFKSMGLAEDEEEYEDEEYEEYEEEGEAYDNIEEFARDCCDEFLADEEVDESSFESSKKILRGLNIDADEEVYLIHDDTMFKSGKNGFAITSAGISCRLMGESEVDFVAWEDFADRSDLDVEDNKISQDGVYLCYFTDSSDVFEGPLTDLFYRLYEGAQGLF